jgi:hypothetical protein
MLVIPVLGRLRQEDCEFEASLGYTVRPYLETKKKAKHIKNNFPKQLVLLLLS